MFDCLADMKPRNDKWTHLLVLACLAGPLLAGPGCAMVRRGPQAMVDSLMSQPDAVLVRDAAPAYLLLLDALVGSSPRNRKLLLASADANTAYAAAFLSSTEPGRARLMYVKARDYGLRVLCRSRKFREAREGSVVEFERAVLSLGKRYVPAMYTTASAWIGWIINSPDSITATADLPRALALMRRVMELEPGHRFGGAEMVFGIYCAVQPRGAGRDLDKSKRYFLEAMKHAGPDNLLPRVAYAEFYARYSLDQDLFESTLKEVLEHETVSPEFGLMNAVSKKRAVDLLERVDDLF